MFILFDEDQAIMEFAKRGLTKTFKMSPTVYIREPMVGWKCLLCGRVLSFDKTPEGECFKCTSPDLEPIFGETQFLLLQKERTNFLKRQAEMERKAHYGK